MSDNNPYAPPRTNAASSEDERDLYGTGRVRGWLAFLCAVLMYISPLVFIVTTYLEFQKVAGLLDLVPGLRTTLILETLLGGALAVFGFVAGRRLHAIHRDAVPLAKKFLIANVAYTALSGFLPFLLMPTMTPEGRAAVTELATKNGGRGFAFFAIWFLYLTYSKQVRERFPR